MKIRQVFDFETTPVSLRSACDISRACTTHVAVAHLAVQFGLGHQRRHGIDHQHVDGAGSDQRAGDFERLFAVVGLRDQQVIDVHAQLAGISGIERMFDVDERRHAAPLLRFGDHLQRNGGFAGRLRTDRSR